MDLTVAKNQNLAVMDDRVREFVGYENTLKDVEAKLKELPSQVTLENKDRFRDLLKEANTTLKNYETIRKSVTAPLNQLAKDIISVRDEKQSPLNKLFLENKQKLERFITEEKLRLQKKKEEEEKRRKAEEAALREKQRLIQLALDTVTKINNSYPDVTSKNTVEGVLGIKHGTQSGVGQLLEINNFTEEQETQITACLQSFLAFCDNRCQSIKDADALQAKMKAAEMDQKKEEAERLKLEQEAREKDEELEALKLQLEQKDLEVQMANQKQELVGEKAVLESEAKEDEYQSRIREKASRVKGTTKELGEVKIVDMSKVPDGILKVEVLRSKVRHYCREHRTDKIPGLEITWNDKVKL